MNTNAARIMPIVAARIRAPVRMGAGLGLGLGRGILKSEQELVAHGKPLRAAIAAMFKMVYDYVGIDGRPTGARLNAALRDEQ